MVCVVIVNLINLVLLLARCCFLAVSHLLVRRVMNVLAHFHLVVQHRLVFAVLDAQLLRVVGSLSSYLHRGLAHVNLLRHVLITFQYYPTFSLLVSHVSALGVTSFKLTRIDCLFH